MKTVPARTAAAARGGSCDFYWQGELGAWGSRVVLRVGRGSSAIFARVAATWPSRLGDSSTRKPHLQPAFYPSSCPSLSVPPQGAGQAVYSPRKCETPLLQTSRSVDPTAELGCCMLMYSLMPASPSASSKSPLSHLLHTPLGSCPNKTVCLSVGAAISTSPHRPLVAAMAGRGCLRSRQRRAGRFIRDAGARGTQSLAQRYGTSCHVPLAAFLRSTIACV